MPRARSERAVRPVTSRSLNLGELRLANLHGGPLEFDDDVLALRVRLFDRLGEHEVDDRGSLSLDFDRLNGRERVAARHVDMTLEHRREALVVGHKRSSPGPRAPESASCSTTPCYSPTTRVRRAGAASGGHGRRWTAGRTTSSCGRIVRTDPGVRLPVRGSLHRTRADPSARRDWTRCAGFTPGHARRVDPAAPGAAAVKRGCTQ